nr:unnamed protein product [Digitaria exilis]
MSANYADNVLEGGGPPGLFSPSGLYTHKPPSTLSPKEQPCAPNWAAPEPHRAKSSTSSPNPNPIHTKSRKTAMAGGEGSSRSKGAKRKAEAMKEIAPTDEAAPAGDIPCVEDPISDWPTSILKEKYIKILELDGFLAAQEISRWRCAHEHEYPTEETEEIAQVSEESRAKAGATSRGGERSKRAASTEPMAPVPKKARTLPKPRARAIPEERAKVSPHRKSSSSVGIAIGEIGTSMPQQGSSARQPLSDEEILHNIFNPVSAPFIRTTPVVEEPCPAGPSAPEQEAEEEFTLGEPEIPMRPEEPPVDHAAVEPEAIAPEEPRVMPETTLPEVPAAVPSSLPVPEGAHVGETIAEVLADIEQLVTQAVIEETEVERRDQNTAEPPSVTETTQIGAEAVPEAECSRGKQAEASTQEQTIEEIPRVPKGTGAEEEIGSFHIGSYDPMLNPNPQAFEYILDAEEDEEHIDRGLYHAERAVAYFKAVGKASRKKTEYIHNISLMHAKADRLQKELECEREDRKLQEAEDTNMIRTLHLRT